MRNRTFLVSALIACCIHALLLLVNLGMTVPTLASTPSAIEVSLVAPPESASISPAAPVPPPPAVKPEQKESPKPEIEPEPGPEPPPEVVPLPEPEPLIEPEPVEPEAEEQPVDIEIAREIHPATVEPAVTATARNAPASESPSGIHELTGDKTESIAQDEYVGDAVDQMPSYAHNPKPAYPWKARRRGQQGTVTLMAEVLSNGRVGKVQVEKSSGYELLDRAAVKAVREWRFIPARRGATSVTWWVRIPVEFDLKD